VLAERGEIAPGRAKFQRLRGQQGQPAALLAPKDTKALSGGRHPSKSQAAGMFPPAGRKRQEAAVRPPYKQQGPAGNSPGGALLYRERGKRNRDYRIKHREISSNMMIKTSPMANRIVKGIQT